MPIVSPSRCRSIAAGALALAAGALAGCSRGERAMPSGESAVADAAVVAKPSASAPNSAATSTPSPPSPQPASPALLPGSPDVSELIVILEPVAKGETPAELLVTDPLGRRTGVEPVSFRSVAEITSASYDSAPPPTQTDSDPEPGPLPKQFDLVTPRPGNYSVLAVGRRAGGYSLIVRLTTPGGEVREGSVRGSQIRAGELQRFGFIYDRAHRGALAITRQ